MLSAAVVIGALRVNLDRLNGQAYIDFRLVRNKSVYIQRHTQNSNYPKIEPEEIWRQIPSWEMKTVILDAAENRRKLESYYYRRQFSHKPVWIETQVDLMKHVSNCNLSQVGTWHLR